MAFQQIPPLWVPNVGGGYGQSPSFSSSLLIDATGEKAAYLGQVWRPDRLGGDITRVGFRFGTVTKAGGSGLTVSLQDYDPNNSPMRPDEVIDQSVAIANGNASFATNSWIRTNPFDSNRTVAFGENLAVVIEFDGAGRLGTDSFIVTGLQRDRQFLTIGGALKTASWVTAPVPSQNVVLEFTDGVFGSLSPTAIICSACAQLGYNSGTAGADEYALEFSLPFTCKIDGGWFDLNIANANSNFEFVIYEGTTALRTVAVDANSIQATSGTLSTTFSISELTLTANTVYRLAAKPTTTNGITLTYIDVADANHWQATSGGTAFRMAQRVDGGAWTTTTTRRPFAGVRVSSIDVGSGGSSGGLFTPRSMSGGYEA